jgi:predicted negative regulator of RcsB-dependent stress response
MANTALENAAQEVNEDLFNVCALLMGLQSVLHEEGHEDSDMDRIARVAVAQIQLAQAKLDAHI